MLKHWIIFLMMIALLISFSAVAFAEVEGKAPQNSAGVKVLVEYDGSITEYLGELVILFLQILPDAAENGNADNPIVVAGK